MNRLIKFAFDYVKEEKRVYLPALAIILATTLLQLPVPFLFKRLIDGAVYERQINSFAIGSLLFLSIILLREFGRFLSSLSLEKALVRIIKRIKVDTVDRFLKHSYYPHEKEGYVVSRVYDEPDDLRELFFDFFVLVIRNVSMFLFGIFALLSISTRMTLVVLTLVPLYVYLTVWGRGILEKLVSPVIEKNAEVRGYLTNVLGLTGDFKLFDNENFFIKKVDAEIGELYKKYLDYIRSAYKYNMLLGVLSDLTPIIVICYGIYEVYKNRLTIGGLFAFTSMYGYLLNPVVTLLNLRVSLVKVEQIRERLENFYRTSEKPSLKLNKAKPVIKVSNLSLNFCGRTILDGVNFEVLEGEKVLIIGKNGTGKSTFLKVLSGLIKDFSGDVELFFEPYKDVSALLDTSGLFRGTVFENIVFGEKYDAKRLYNVIEIIGLDKTNLSLDSFVDINGKNLSQGEKQRILLARTLYKEASLYLFDEPLEHIPLSEAMTIYDNTLKFLYNRTVISVMHITAGLEDLHDKIFEMKGHKLTEIEKN